MSADSPQASDRQLAMALMQPTFIRVIDQLRLAQERSDWVGKYETMQAWPPQTTPQEQAEVLWLYDRKEGAATEDLVDLKKAAHTPQLAAIGISSSPTARSAI